jgi:hypothetical protein
LLVVEIPERSGFHRIDVDDFVLLDLRGCEHRENAVSLYRGNEISEGQCDGHPMTLKPSKVIGVIKSKNINRLTKRYTIKISYAEFVVDGNGLL